MDGGGLMGCFVDARTHATTQYAEPDPPLVPSAFVGTDEVVDVEEKVVDSDAGTSVPKRMVMKESIAKGGVENGSGGDFREGLCGG